VPIFDLLLIAEASPHVEHVVEHGGIVEKTVEHVKEIGLKDFLPGFLGYWLHAVSHNPWHRLMRLLPKALRGGGH
jgi:hypothetical protein